jgi:DUF2934 family protein
MAKLAFIKQGSKKDSSRKGALLATDEGGSVRDKQELHNDRDAHIAARAYQLFEQRGRRHGYAFQDWLQAEKELYGTTV